MRTAAHESGARAAGESGFEIAGADGAYVDAGARILPGDGERVTVRVEASQIDSPTAVRYAWKSWGPAPLFNGAEPAGAAVCRGSARRGGRGTRGGHATPTPLRYG